MNKFSHLLAVSLVISTGTHLQAKDISSSGSQNNVAIVNMIENMEDMGNTDAKSIKVGIDDMETINSETTHTLNTSPQSGSISHIFSTERESQSRRNSIEVLPTGSPQPSQHPQSVEHSSHNLSVSDSPRQIPNSSSKVLPEHSDHVGSYALDERNRTPHSEQSSNIKGMRNSNNDKFYALNVVSAYQSPMDKLNMNPTSQHVFQNAAFKSLSVYDPLESFNRWMYYINYHADKYVMLPVVHGYEYITPNFIRSGVSNFFANLDDVSNLFNSVLQLKVHQSMEVTARLLLNTTIGVFGVWDPATMMGLAKYDEDFGLTLGHYGVPNGPYLMLPLLGPSNARDATGTVADFVAEDLINYENYERVSNRNVELDFLWVINERYVTPVKYGDLNSPYEYAQVRYLYTKERELKINE